MLLSLYSIIEIGPELTKAASVCALKQSEKEMWCLMLGVDSQVNIMVSQFLQAIKSWYLAVVLCGISWQAFPVRKRITQSCVVETQIHKHTGSHSQPGEYFWGGVCVANSGNLINNPGLYASHTKTLLY